MSAREPQTEEEQIKAIMAAHGVSREDAEFILGIERGEIEGDVVDVSADGE
jgi:hypothetical protein